MSRNTQQASAAAIATQSSRTRPGTVNPDTSEECVECGATSTGRSEEGTRYCRECGLVLSGYPVERSEPGWISREQRRTGPASSVTRESVGTSIGASPSDPSAGILVHHNNRLEYSTRALKAGLREVRSLCAACDLSDDTAERAAYLYRQAANADILQGRSREGIAAACVYTAARRYGQPVTLSDISVKSPVDEKRISTDYRTVLQELGIGLRPPKPQEFLAKVATAADVPYCVQRRARKLLVAVTDAGEHVGQSPTGVAAAAVYLAAEQCDFEITQEVVAEAADVSTVTISRQSTKLRNVLE